MRIAGPILRRLDEHSAAPAPSALAARARCEIACFSAADHWPSVRPPGGSPGRLEQGVVAEAAIAAQVRWRSGRGTSPPGEDPEAAPRARLARERQREDAHVAGAAPVGRQAARARGAAWRCCRRVGGVGPGVAAGEDARAAVERIHLEAGVVGERGQAGPSRVVARLDPRVGLERERRSRRARRRCPGRRARAARRRRQVEQLRQLAQLVPGARGDQQPRRYGTPGVGDGSESRPGSEDSSRVTSPTMRHGPG